MAAAAAAAVGAVEVHEEGPWCSMHVRCAAFEPLQSNSRVLRQFSVGPVSLFSFIGSLQALLVGLSQISYIQATDTSRV